MVVRFVKRACARMESDKYNLTRARTQKQNVMNARLLVIYSHAARPQTIVAGVSNAY